MVQQSHDLQFAVLKRCNSGARKRRRVVVSSGDDVVPSDVAPSDAFTMRNRKKKSSRIRLRRRCAAEEGQAKATTRAQARAREATHLEALILQHLLDGDEFARLDELRLNHDAERAGADEVQRAVRNAVRLCARRT